MGLTIQLTIVLVIGFLVGVYYFYDVYRRKKRDKELGRVIRILLFEQIGNDKVFRGQRKGFEKTDDELGVYLFINKDKRAIADVDHSDLFYDDKFSKCLLVVKYSDDDYRAMSRLSNEHWFKKESVEVPILDKNGDQVYEELKVLNELGETVIEKKPLFEVKQLFRGFKEPIAITSDSRMAARFERRFTKRMREKRAENKPWLEKYAPYMTVALVAIIMVIGFAYMTNKLADTNKELASRFVEGATDYKAAVENPSYIEGLVNKWEAKKLVEEAPPK